MKSILKVFRLLVYLCLADISNGIYWTFVILPILTIASEEGCRCFIQILLLHCLLVDAYLPRWLYSCGGKGESSSRGGGGDLCS